MRLRYVVLMVQTAGGEKGPHVLDTLRLMFEYKELTEDTPVFCEGMPGYAPLREVHSLLEALKQAPSADAGRWCTQRRCCLGPHDELGLVSDVDGCWVSQAREKRKKRRKRRKIQAVWQTKPWQLPHQLQLLPKVHARYWCPTMPIAGVYAALILLQL